MRLDPRILPTCKFLLLFATSAFAAEDAKETLKREAIEAAERLIERVEKGETLKKFKFGKNARSGRNASRAEDLLPLGTSLVKLGDFDRARTTFQKAIAVAETIAPNERFVQPHFLTRIAEAQAEMGDKVVARETFLRSADAIERSTRPNLIKSYDWSCITDASRRWLNDREAADIFKRYELFINTSQDRSVVAERETLRLKLLICRGDYDEAARRLADPERFKKDPRERARAADTVVRMIGGDNSHSSPARKAAAIRYIANQKRFLLADPDPLGKRFGLVAFGFALARLGRIEDGLAELQAIHPLPSQGIDERDSIRALQAESIGRLAELSLNTGDKAGAIGAARKALEIDATIELGRVNISGFIRAIDVLARSGDPNAALTGLNRIGPRSRSWLSGMIVHEVADAFVARGQPEQAREVERRALKVVHEELLYATTPAPDETKQEAHRRKSPLADLTAELAEYHFRQNDRLAALRAIGGLPIAERDLARAKVAEYRASAGDATTALELLRDMTDRLAADRATVKAALSAFRK